VRKTKGQEAMMEMVIHDNSNHSAHHSLLLGMLQPAQGGGRSAWLTLLIG